MCIGSCGYLEDPLTVCCGHNDNINILYKPGNILSSWFTWGILRGAIPAEFY